jgi:hypothetical protein
MPFMRRVERRDSQAIALDLTSTFDNSFKSLRPMGIARRLPKLEPR